MRGGGLDEIRNVRFRDFVRKVHAWLNVASASRIPPQQAAALQRGPGGFARKQAIIHHHQLWCYATWKLTDGVACIIHLLSTKFENLEDELQLTSGTALIDFR
eukprot:4406707-Pyramimonas_sp.AAC.1